MSPLKNRVRVFRPNLMRLRESERHNMPAQRLVGVVGIGRVPMPFRVPMHEVPRRGDGGVFSVHQRQIRRRVLHFAIAHIREQGYDSQVLTHHGVVDTRHRFGRTPTTPVHMHISRIPTSRFRPGSIGREGVVE